MSSPNAVALLALGTLAVIRCGSRFPWICLIIILVGGLGVWVIGRPAIHVGASGLVFGLFGYLLVRGVRRLQHSFRPGCPCGCRGVWVDGSVWCGANQ